jgi:3-deoxy-D-manno-octulosonic-acid transferase
MSFIYNFIFYPILHGGFLIAGLFNNKIRQGLAMRKNQSWIKPIEKDVTWVWFHVSSGELEYAKPVMRILKANGQFKHKILVTHFSPSVVESLKKTKEVDLFVPMPWDTPWHWKKFLKHYKPKILAISRTDAWPNLVWQARKYKIPSLIFSATLPRHSGRVSSFWGRLFFESIFKDLNKISVVSAEDRDNFLRLSDDLPVSVDGDTRFDQAISRVAENRELPAWTQKLPSPVFIAGSTWPEDEHYLLPALKGINLTALIAPHEPTESHLCEIEKKLSQLGLTSVRFSQVKIPLTESIILVDRVGVLADLYRLGTLAFIGGSFKKSVHSVMEPAASGCFTFFGPYHHNNREALALKKIGLAKEVLTTEDIKKILLENNKADRQNILNFVQSHKGVSQKMALWITENLSS